MVLALEKRREPLPPSGLFSPCLKVGSGSDLRVPAWGVRVLAPVSECVCESV